MGCDWNAPEVVVENKLGSHVLIRNPSFNGCLWSTTLASGEYTTPQQCLSGTDQVHFQKFDIDSFCEDQAAANPDAGAGDCTYVDGGSSELAPNRGPGSELPLWFNYQTLQSYSISQGDFLLITIEAGAVEQDFSVPGPYGH